MTALRRLAFVLTIAGAALLASPSSATAACPHGISGHVTIAPISPLGHASRPYVATIVVSGHNRAWTVQSNVAGDFAITVPPGTYVVRGTTSGLLPHAPAPITVIVRPRGVTVVSLVYDSGIR